MKFRFLLAGASAVTLASFAAVTACGGTEAAATTTSGGASVPTATGGATVSKNRQVFAARKVFLGDTDRSGTENDNAWKKFGYDLDDKRTTQKSKDVCLPSAGGPPIVDGDNGIDNSFGGGVLALIKAVLARPTEATQKSVDAGEFTLMFDLTGLSEDAKQSNTGLVGQVLVPGPFDKPGTGEARIAPNWSDPANLDIPVRSNLINGGNAADSKIKFTEVYVTNGLLVAKADSIDLTLNIGGVNAVLAIKNAVVTANHATPTTLTGGTIVGILEIDRLRALITDIGPKLSEQLCPGSPQLKTINDALETKGDIIVGGPNVPGTCNGISIALGFDAVQVKTPTVVYNPPVSTTPEKDFCTVATDAGVGQ